MKRNILTGLLALILATLACGVGGSDTDQDATVEALSQSIRSTAETEDIATPTTAVDTQSTVAAVQETATQQVEQFEATQVVEATEVSVEATLTSEFLEPIKSELQSYGVDPSEGRLGWVHPPLDIDVEEYLGYSYGGKYLATVARDFVLASDITWNTQFGSTGCGYVIRSNGDEEAFDQYLVMATRGAEGHVGFIIMEDGNAITDEITDFYANGIDPEFEWQNDTTNRMVVVGRGNTFSIYTNGTLLGEVTPSVAFDRGFIAFVALNESGYTHCHFDNTYLWLLE